VALPLLIWLKVVLAPLKELGVTLPPTHSPMLISLFPRASLFFRLMDSHAHINDDIYEWMVTHKDFQLS
jgi:hypothetical protein